MEFENDITIWGELGNITLHDLIVNPIGESFSKNEKIRVTSRELDVSLGLENVETKVTHYVRLQIKGNEMLRIKGKKPKKEPW